jgi:RHS repeat-associated protein
VATESVNGGSSITFQYDPDSLLTGAGALTLTRHPQHGLLTGTTLGNVTDSYTYSPFGELDTYQANSSGSPILGVTYTRDSLGRITEKTETIGGTTTTTVYGYDTAGRLTDVTQGGTLVAHYEYDGNGNRLSVTRPTGTVTGTYDAQDRLTTYGAVTYSYSANGDLQTATSGSETTTYSYDVFGNLTAVSLPNGTQIEYVIDGRNRRIGRKVNGTLVQGFLYGSQLRPVAELDGTGTVMSRFIYGTKINVPEYMIKSGVTYRVITDHLGSPRLVVNTADGTVTQHLDYDEFGQVTLDTNPGFQPFGFAGGLYDPDTKLVRFGLRDYDPFTGRWTTKDPIRFAGGDSNLFAYTEGDPINQFDPNGRDLREWWDASTAVGPYDAYQAGTVDRSAAETAARQSGLPGPHNGPQDAFRHCVWSCLMTQRLGPEEAKAIGDIHEAAGMRQGQPSNEELMDLLNNAVGRQCGQQQGKKPCSDRCMDAYKSCRLFGPGGVPLCSRRPTPTR